MYMIQIVLIKHALWKHVTSRVKPWLSKLYRKIVFKKNHQVRQCKKEQWMLKKIERNVQFLKWCGALWYTDMAKGTPYSKY